MSTIVVKSKLVKSERKNNFFEEISKPNQILSVRGN